MRITAAVTPTKGAPFEVDSLDLDKMHPDEGARTHRRFRRLPHGRGHPDQLYPTALPAMLGHEGAGIVEAVGA